MKKQAAPTMKDVAREAGVALGTVSKVINHIPVGEAYRVRVEEAIQSLGYEVNTYARGLKTQQTNTITLIVPDVINPFYASFTHYVESALYQNNCKLVLCCSNGIPEKELQHLNQASQNKSDGVIALTYSDISKDMPQNLPMVAFDRFFENSHIPRVASDNRSGGVIATEKLLELGCRHPAFIRFHSRFPGEADKRIDGYLDVCKKHNIEPILLDQYDSDDSLELLTRFIEEHVLPNGSLAFDGIFSNTDYHAYEALRLLQAKGYHIPDDVQIIGFDGIHKFGFAGHDLFVSSICQPIPELARTCVDIVLAKDRSLLPSLTLLPVSYQYGGTTRA